MVDSVLFPFSGRIILDASGDVVSGAKLEVFDSGTSNQQTVYEDSGLATPAANPIVASSSGEVPVRYVGTSAYKVTFKDSVDVTLSNYTTWDSIRGAVDTSTFLTGTVSPARSVISKSTTYTTVAGDAGKQINCDATGGSFTLSLLSAVTAADGGDYVIKHSGTAGEVTVSATGGQTLDGRTSYVMQAGDSIEVRSDGSNWHIGTAYNKHSGIVTVTPTSPITIDADYPSGTNFQISPTTNITINAPTGTVAGQHFTITIIQDATGGRVATFNAAFVGEFDIGVGTSEITILDCHVRATSIIDTSRRLNISAIPDVIVEDQKAAGVTGGGATSGSWETRVLNTLVRNRGTMASLASNEVTLPAGTYYIKWQAPAYSVNRHQTRLYDVTGAASLKSGSSNASAAAAGIETLSIGSTVQTFTAPNAIRIENQVQTTSGVSGMGLEANFGEIEVYSRMEIWRL